MANKVAGHIPCPLCGYEHQEVRITLGGKPYVICDECGMQLFARQARSVRILNQKAVPVAEKEIQREGKAGTPAGVGSEKARPVAAPVSIPAPPVPAKEKTIFDIFGG